MARQRINDKDKRVVQVNIRLTVEENNKLNQYAAGSGLSPANWIRHKVFVGRFPPVKMSPLDTSVYLEFKRICVNINQVTHRINAGEFPKEYLVRQLELTMILSKIIKALINDRQSDQG